MEVVTITAPLQHSTGIVNVREWGPDVGGTYQTQTGSSLHLEYLPIGQPKVGGWCVGGFGRAVTELLCLHSGRYCRTRWEGIDR